MKKKVIGIVGGVGPYAGLDLNTKIFDNTVSGKDQEHLEVYLLSRSPQIEDRTEFLLDSQLPNPAEGLFETIVKLEQLGAEIVGIPCNTAHSLKIFQPLREKIAQASLKIKLLHLIEETYHELQRQFPTIIKVGLLSTKGTYVSGVYSQVLEREQKYQVLIPSEMQQDEVHQAIYHPDFGIKAYSNPVTKPAIETLTRVSNDLIAAGAEAIIMGCTEIPLALKPKTLPVPLIDPTNILARALVSQAAPEQLLPYT